MSLIRPSLTYHYEKSLKLLFFRLLSSIDSCPLGDQDPLTICILF